MFAIYSGPSCNFPQPREAASIANSRIVRSLACGWLRLPIQQQGMRGTAKNKRRNRGIIHSRASAAGIATLKANEKKASLMGGQSSF
jgi:hypothetical protein